jgi:hypothetical protein
MLPYRPLGPGNGLLPVPCGAERCNWRRRCNHQQPQKSACQLDERPGEMKHQPTSRTRRFEPPEDLLIDFIRRKHGARKPRTDTPDEAVRSYTCGQGSVPQLVRDNACHLIEAQARHQG